MKLFWTCVTLAVALLMVPGCAKKKVEISSLDRKKAEAFVSEAQFALTIKDYARAEGLYAQATAVCPDTGGYWVGLGSVRMRLGQRDAAKSAYNSALRAYEETLREKKDDTDAAVQHVYVLALLGRVDDAKAALAKLPAQFPTDPDVKAFVEGKQLDRMLAEPHFKEIAL